MKIKIAMEQDLDEIISIDEVAICNATRRKSMQSRIENECAIVAIEQDRVVGYAVLEYTFFSNGFISILVVKNEFRRKGIASSLLKKVEEMCVTEKLFTSTNKSNIAMQKLMLLNSYEASGVVYNLDEGDPEIFYFKSLGAAKLNV